MSDWIRIEGLRVDCIIGITEPEQRTLQPIEIDLGLGLELDAAAGGDLTESVDYALVAEQVRFLAEHGQWRLIESLAAAIARLVLAPTPPGLLQATVDRVEVRVRKPTVLDLAVPSVSIARAAEWCELQTRMVPDRTWLDVLVETPQVGAYRAHLEPGCTWVVPSGAAVLVVAGGVELGAKRWEAGRRLARGEATQLKAVGGGPASLVVVTAPPIGAPAS